MTDRWRFNAAPTEPEHYTRSPENRPEPRMTAQEWAEWHRQRVADGAAMVAAARRALVARQAEVDEEAV